MNINEKLDFISALEEDGYGQRTIESLIESLEHPETSSRSFTTAEEMFAAIDSEMDNTEGTPDEECDEKGVPIL